MAILSLEYIFYREEIISICDGIMAAVMTFEALRAIAEMFIGF